MPPAEQLVRQQYRSLLQGAGIPFDPARRTPEQAQAAALMFWSAQNAVALDAATITQAVVEG